MRKISRNTIAAAGVILLLGALGLWLWPNGRPESIRGMETSMHHASMAVMIRSAKTPADHEALARHYEAAAQRLDDDASRQERVAPVHATSIAGRRTFQGLATHCSNVARDLRAATAEDRALARLHREAAKSGMPR